MAVCTPHHLLYVTSACVSAAWRLNEEVGGTIQGGECGVQVPTQPPRPLPRTTNRMWHSAFWNPCSSLLTCWDWMVAHLERLSSPPWPLRSTSSFARSLLREAIAGQAVNYFSSVLPGTLCHKRSFIGLLVSSHLGQMQGKDLTHCCVSNTKHRTWLSANIS